MRAPWLAALAATLAAAPAAAQPAPALAARADTVRPLRHLTVDPSTAAVHPFAALPGECERCHEPIAVPASSRCDGCHEDGAARDPQEACTTFCRSCHEELRDHHPTGVKLARRPAAPLHLTADGRNQCITCHAVNRTRWDAEPWRSRSFMSRLAGAGGRQPTHFLVMRNDRGQLCRNCH